MAPQPPPSADQPLGRALLADGARTLAVLVAGGGVVLALSLWHRLLAAVRPTGTDAPRTPAETDPRLVEYELDWYRYLKAFDAHHGPGGSPDRAIRSGSFLRGMRTWLATRCLRGYTLGNEVYVCPNAPRVLRVHQAGHAPAFGREFPTLVRPRRDDGGLEDAPLYTADVMLPGRFPHTLLRLRDPRGLREAYEAWRRDGRIARVTT
ncbi:hypothetical protein [Haloplanus halophilus]|uniref:hypothetical protein n=1 Tax=Haloplanus halophilus TaxID=2949993 RepID=UPI00203EC6BA|nr:hypothetical protein [Haloplanus sp. GDY1]